MLQSNTTSLPRLGSGIRIPLPAPIKSSRKSNTLGRYGAVNKGSHGRIATRERLTNIWQCAGDGWGIDERKVRSLFSRVVSWVFPFLAVAFFLSEYGALFDAHMLVALALAPVVAVVLYVSTSVLAGSEL
jgi:hypothetical protein